MDGKVVVIGTGFDGLSSLLRLRLSELINDGIISIPSVCVSEIEGKPIIETFDFKPVEILPMPFSRKEKSPYKCDGTLKRGRIK
jgi:hypothetical protein